jgi:23S rRNA-/tRNA-specific pseudouridylate synthase
MATNKRLPKNYFLNPIGNLDRMASGIQLFALNSTINRELEKYWNTERLKRRFIALVKGDIKEETTIQFPLKNEFNEKQLAITRCIPVQSFGIASHVKVWTDTDINHQIRRHFSRRCMHVIGDRKFGDKKSNDYFKTEMELSRLFLHSDQLIFDLKSYNRTMKFHSPLPIELDLIIGRLNALCVAPLFG